MAHVTATSNVTFVKILADNIDIVIKISLAKFFKSQLKTNGRPSENFNSKCEVAFSTSFRNL